MDLDIILIDTFLNIVGLILLCVLRVIGKKRRFQKKTVFLINIFSLYFIVRLLKIAVDPLGFTKLIQWISLIEALLLALAVIKTAMFAVLELILNSRKGVEIPKIIQDTIFVIFYFFLIMVILKETLNINLTSILTTSAVLTMVLGLSIQDNLSNLFSGLAIQLEKPFSIGEWIEFEGVKGKVKELNWRSVKLLTLENDLLIIPNNKIIKENVVNFNRPTHLHIARFNVGVSYKHPPNDVKQSILSILREEKDIAHEPKPIIRLVDYGDFSITYEIRYYLTNFNRILQIEDSITTKIWYAFRRDGIHIPFPIRDVNLRTISDDHLARERENEITNLVTILKKVDIFTPLSDDELRSLALGGRAMFFAAGESVIKEGDEGDSMFLVLRGEVDVVITSAGYTRSVATLSRDDFFGERSLMTGEDRNATITALTDCKIFIIDKANFKSVISAHQEVLTQISEILSKREFELHEKKEEATKRVSERQVQENSSQILKNIMRFLGF